MHSTFEKEGIAMSLLDITNCVTWEKYATLFPGVVVISIVACLFPVKQTNKQNNKKQNKANNGKDNQTIKKTYLCKKYYSFVNAFDYLKLRKNTLF